MPEPDTLRLEDGRVIAHYRTPAQEGITLPGVTFLGGYASDMTGTKALALEEWARGAGRAFLRFDYTGHGASSGLFEDGTIGSWARDAMEAIAHLTTGPQVLVGSSMGGWIALLAARAMPERVAALVGIAAAPDFTEDLMWPALTEAQRDAVLEAGKLSIPSQYDDGSMVYTRALFEDGRAQLVLRDPLPLPFPVRLIQGTADEVVPVSVALRILDHIGCADARAILVKDGDHRMSGAAELALLTRTIEDLPL